MHGQDHTSRLYECYDQEILNFMNRLIFHIDVNSAFLSWESARRLRNQESDLRLVPAVIGGDPRDRTSVVLAKSIPAKKYGIITGEPVSSALRKCPDLVIAPSDFRLYRECSQAFKAICREYAPVVEEFSIDECFLDMSGTSRIYPDPLSIAFEIKDKIRDDLGFTVNVGISSNKLLSKMASDFEKPDKVHTLFPSEIPRKMWPLPVGDLFLCGKQSAQKLMQSNIFTIGDLAHAELSYIQRLLGVKLGETLYQYANGVDSSPVNAQPEAPKGYSNETTFREDVVSYEQGDQVLLYLSDQVGSRVRKDHIKAYCICVTIRGADRKKHSHQCNLPTSTDITSEIYQVSKGLLRQLWDGKKPLRLMGIALTNLDDGTNAQMSFFDNGKRKREEKADQAIDAIRSRYGKDLIQRGSLLGTTHHRN